MRFDKENTPIIRFPDFSNMWEKKSLSSLGIFIGGGTPSTNNKEFWDGDIPWVSSSDIDEGDIFKVNIHRFINEKAIRNSATKLIVKGSILFVSRVGVGKLAVSNQNLCTSQDFANFTPNKGNCYFLAYYFLAKNSLLLKFAQGTSIKGFTSGDLKSIPVVLPVSLLEQQKIASFLSAVDKRIELLQKKKDLLEDYKKGVMQKVFSQEIRFKDENGNDFPDWEEKRVSEVLKERNKKSIKNQNYPLMSFMAGKGVAPKGERYNREFLVNDSDNKKYKQTELGDFIYSSNNLETGSIGLNKYGSATISPVYSIFQIDSASDINFIESYFTRKAFIYKMVRFRQGVVYGQWRIHESEFLKIKELIPSSAEQQKIASFLSAIDSKIETTNQQIEGMQSFKKGLLQQMFV